LSLIFGFRLHVYIHDFNINLVLDNAFLLIEMAGLWVKYVKCGF
jgi:hypothetical protein